MRCGGSGIGRAWFVVLACLIVGGGWADGLAPRPLGAHAKEAGAATSRAGSGIPSQRYVEWTILRSSDLQASDRFSHSMAISGDTAVIGAWAEDGGGGDPHADAGVAYMFLGGSVGIFKANVPAGGPSSALSRRLGHASARSGNSWSRASTFAPAPHVR